MSMPFYVPPEQLMKDRADYARKGIARGRSVLAIVYADGILFGTQNPSRGLYKISEIYDRVGFGAVGKYNEFENLRVSGIRYADMRGYAYDRDDVTARSLANAYAQTLGTAFTTEAKPLEVEIVVAEVGETPAADQIYRISYDGTVIEERDWVVIGGSSQRLSTEISQRWEPGFTLKSALIAAVSTLESESGAGREIPPAELEVAVLERAGRRRTFRRLNTGEITDHLAREVQE